MVAPQPGTSKSDPDQLCAEHRDLLGVFKVESLRIYPVKSCQPLDLDEAQITRWGLEHDRRFAVVARDLHEIEETKWHIESIYEMRPQLARVKPVLDGLDGGRGRATALRLTVEHGCMAGQDVVIPLREKAGARPRLFLSSMYGTNPSIEYAEDEGPEASEWLTRVLDEGAPDAGRWAFHLAWLPPGVASLCAANTVYGHLFHSDEEKSFAANAQYLIANRDSLRSINARIRQMGDEIVHMNRFRPNIIVYGAQPWEEETWRVVRIGHEADQSGVFLRACMSALRCTETTVQMQDIGGGWAGKRDEKMQPLKALKQYHAGPAGKPRFGVFYNLFRDPDSTRATVSRDEPGQARTGVFAKRVRVGDAVTVVERIEGTTLLDVSMAVPEAAQLTRVQCVASSFGCGDQQSSPSAVQQLQQKADEVERAAIAATSGDGTIANVGIKLDGAVACPQCNQRFGSERALELHLCFIHGALADR
eukprot:TRINITY_DN28796_c0_g1_i1.p1 TRINITY_DN28796_c0_g1~~TRINITY_DN28796_c0_g1_i1.p1  ORF type:complete len:499 (+),score=71.42 TRINITY_DN28796_c0_g1_i1:68-1498(+)